VTVKRHDVDRLQRSTRQQIIHALEEDLEGEGMLKEVWEECGTLEERRVVEDEVREVIDWIKGRLHGWLGDAR
jgi:hypothetical protein